MSSSSEKLSRQAKAKFKSQQVTDEFLCRSIATSISDILKFSLNENFRKQTFDLLGVNGAKQAEKEIAKQLESLIRDQNTGKVKRSKSEITNTSGQFLNAISSEQINSSTSTVECDEEAFGPGFEENKKSWLKISTDKYKESLQSRQCYYSQPITYSHISASDSQAHSFEEEVPYRHSQKLKFAFDTSFTHVLAGKRTSDKSNDININNYCSIKFRKLFDDTDKHYSNVLKSYKSCYY